MKKHCLVPISILVIGIVIGIGMHAAIGQQTAPMQLKGMKVIKTSTLDLGPQIEEMRGYRLGMRVIQVEPAGCTPMHSHKDRPGMAYVLQGVVTEQGKSAGPALNPGWIVFRCTVPRRNPAPHPPAATGR